MKDIKVVAIHVWIDSNSARRPYTVSEVNAEGEEVSCIDSYAGRLEAWEQALSSAAFENVPAVEFDQHSREVDRWPNYREGE